jgi:hypothetical protein
MSLNSLLSILTPPQSPAEAPTSEDWEKIEEWLKRLPSDYRAFVDRFGTGKINGFLWILNPASANRYLNLLREMEPILNALKELRDSGEHCPYPLYPEQGGLLPFGKTDNGDGMFWLTVGEPDKWHIIVNASRDSSYEEFKCDMTSFLEGILTRQIHCSIFPDDLPSNVAEFVSTPTR